MFNRQASILRTDHLITGRSRRKRLGPDVDVWTAMDVWIAIGEIAPCYSVSECGA